MSRTLLATEYVLRPDSTCAAPVYVLFGDDAFLKRQCLEKLREEVLEGDDAEFSFRAFDGMAPLRDVLDELRTVSLFGRGPRLVLVEQADGFVSRHRAELEAYASSPSEQGVLVLDVSTWPSHTRLYKLVAAHGTAFDCRCPGEEKLVRWLERWVRERHGVRLGRGVADLLVEMLGPDPGRLDQEAARLSLLVAPKETIEMSHIEEASLGWRAKTVWAVLDATLAGDAGTALTELDRLLAAGEHPVSVLAQLASSLRRFANATRLVIEAEEGSSKPSLCKALEQAGVKPFALAKAEAQLRRLGRQRGQWLHRWLLDTDLALKGTSSSPTMARITLEKLLVRLASPAAKPAGQA